MLLILKLYDCGSINVFIRDLNCALVSLKSIAFLSHFVCTTLVCACYGAVSDVIVTDISYLN